MPNDKRLQVEPNLTIVRRFIDLGVFRTGGREKLQLAAALAEIATANEGRFPTDAVAEHMRGDLRYMAGLDDPDDAVIAAGEVVDIVRAHREQ